MRPREGDLINGKYRLVRPIGDGGMGSVFEARHEYLGTAVALKFLHPELAKRPGLVARFLQEARVSATIKSHHIAHVTDVDQTNDGAAFLVMELLPGESLQTILGRDKKLPLYVALDYTLQILAGLDAAHAMAVVHRDLKPDNVFVVPTPRGPLVKLLDFGIAKLRTSAASDAGLTRPGMMMGTPEYMAPEQVYAADRVDARADVYSVGAMLYEMLSGGRPTEGDDAPQIAAFIAAGKVRPLNTLEPSVPEGLAQAIHRAMAADPEARFASVAEFRAAILPFCGPLSLAGRLAATPPAGGVAPTLPPGDDRGSTEPRTPPQDASPPMAATAGTFTPQTPPTPHTPNAAPWGATQTPAARYIAQPAVTQHPRKRFSASLLLLLAMGVAAAGVGVLVVVTSSSGEETRTPPDTVARTTPAVSTALAPTTPPAALPPAAAIPPPIQPAATPVATTGTPRPQPKPAHSADASAPDAAPSTTPPVFTLPGLPSGFPLPFPMPSALPPITLPSGFPQIPIPGFPAPAPAASH